VSNKGMLALLADNWEEWETSVWNR